MSVIDFRAHHVGLSIPDLEASIKWYGDVLGFEVEKRMEIPPIGAKIAYLKRDDFRIELFEMDKAAPMSEDRTVPNKDLLTHGWKHLSIEVPDSRAALDKLKAAGVEVAMENVIDGVAMGFIRDNAGNLIEINQVGTPFADK
jgi:methylmalonyl-CoA/ethylmalonyl-CoA epimerase